MNDNDELTEEEIKEICELFLRIKLKRLVKEILEEEKIKE